jgi:xanthine dehydrogenase iron-sulfur cluster and FAD-binding subunit A
MVTLRAAVSMIRVVIGIPDPAPSLAPAPTTALVTSRISQAEACATMVVTGGTDFSLWVAADSRVSGTIVVS